MICLKRTLHVHWRPRKAGAHSLGDDEKLKLKCFLLENMDENDDRVATQLALVVADVARRDWPGNWGELFNSLMETVHTVGEHTSKKVSPRAI